MQCLNDLHSSSHSTFHSLFISCMNYIHFTKPVIEQKDQISFLIYSAKLVLICFPGVVVLFCFWNVVILKFWAPVCYLDPPNSITEKLKASWIFFLNSLVCSNSVRQFPELRFHCSELESCVYGCGILCVPDEVRWFGQDAEAQHHQYLLHILKSRSRNSLYYKSICLECQWSSRRWFHI